jgi:hypothetical protein
MFCYAFLLWFFVSLFFGNVSRSKVDFKLEPTATHMREVESKDLKIEYFVRDSTQDYFESYP